MPDVPTKPAPPFLYGENDLEREASRGADFLRITWRSVSDADSYDVRLENVGVWSDVSQGFRIAALDPNTKYAVKVRAVNSEGESSWSDSLQIYTRPAIPKNLRLSNQADSRSENYLKLEWDSAQGAATYDLKVNDSPEITKITHPFELRTSEIKPNRKYTLKVRSRDDRNGGVSFWSTAFVTVTRPPRPKAPMIDVHALGGAGVVVSWNESAQFNGGGKAFVKLYGSPDTGNDPSGINRPLAGTFDDYTCAYGVVRRYCLQIVAPRSAVPDDALGSDNKSFQGDSAVANSALTRPVDDQPKAPGTNTVASRFAARYGYELWPYELFK
jgi:hypothetical protein